MKNQTIRLDNNGIYVNDVKLNIPDKIKNKGSNISMIDGNVYINGYEYKKMKWRKTLKALWHKIF